MLTNNLGEIIELKDTHTTTEFLKEGVPADREVWWKYTDTIVYPELVDEGIWVSNMGGVMLTNGTEIIDGVEVPIPKTIKYTQNSKWAVESYNKYGSRVEIIKRGKLYPRIYIKVREYRVHTLIAITFSNATEELLHKYATQESNTYVVSHLNDNKWDARAVNLQFTTQSENLKNNDLAQRIANRRSMDITYIVYDANTGSLMFYGPRPNVADDISACISSLAKVTNYGVIFKDKYIIFNTKSAINIPTNIDTAKLAKDVEKYNNTSTTYKNNTWLNLNDYIAKDSPFFTPQSVKSREFFRNLIKRGDT